MTIKEMIAKRAAAMARGKKILDDAAARPADQRKLSTQEQSDYDAAVREAEDLQRQIDAAAQDAETRAAAAPDVTTAVQTAIAERAQRDATIRQRVRTAGLSEDFADQLVRSDVSVDNVGNRIIDEMARTGGNATRAVPSNIIIGFDGTDPANVRSAMVDALVARATARLPQGHRVDMTEQGRSFANHSVLQLFADLARSHGHKIDRNLSNGALYDVLLDIRSLSTSDFPILLADAGNKIMVKAYQLANVTYKVIFARKQFNDFKPHRFIRGGDFPNLLEVGEKGEYQFGAMGEAKQELVLATWGRIIGLSRRIIINDDMGAFADLPGKVGRRVADFENATAWAVANLNGGLGPVITETGQQLFNAVHNNLAGAGAAIAIQSVSDGRAAMMKQTSIDGLKLNITPRYLVTSPDKFTVAEQFCSVNIVPVQDSNANPFKGRLTPVADANLSGNAWQLYADPQDIETMVYGHLEGREGPRLSTREGFTTDGVDLRVSTDFVAGGIDYRGAYRNPGA